MVLKGFPIVITYCTVKQHNFEEKLIVVILYTDINHHRVGTSKQNKTHKKITLSGTRYEFSIQYSLHGLNGAPFSYRNNKLIFMNKNMLRFVKWVLRAYHRYCNGVNTGVFTSKYNFGTVPTIQHVRPLLYT